ncbi:MAG: tRNA lysidine(34) synthetase TilS [Chitinophagaceae bacterium]|nr:tRNA lysidine(34) synthetase TilS [Chitinophagaceae bacterium]
MDLLSGFKAFIEKESLFSHNSHLLLAVSGGVDSVVLCELCSQAGYSWFIAHCNFKLRGEESERDEAFVRKLGEKYNVQVFVKQFDTVAYTQERKVSVQAAARELRYAWFEELVNAESQVSDFKSQISNPVFQIVTAHHADDNAETVWMNFCKGTGIAGIRGILPKAGKLVRPLLFAPKAAILHFAKQNELEYVEDSSNLTDKYTRNYFRQHIIPAVLKVYPEAEAGVQENIARFREVEVLYSQAIEQHKKKLLEYRNGEVHIPVLKLKRSLPLKTIVYEIVKAYNFSSKQTDEIIDLLQRESGRYVLSSTHRVLKNRGWLIITALEKVEESGSAVIVINSGEEAIAFAGGILKLKQENCDKLMLETGHPGVACIDAGAVQYPLLLRRWKAGDYFYPLGMKKKKKLARFFIDQKLSLAEKEKVWVLEMNKKIVWVINYRIDDRFKITASTQSCLRITYLKKNN